MRAWLRPATTSPPPRSTRHETDTATARVRRPSTVLTRPTVLGGLVVVSLLVGLVVLGGLLLIADRAGHLAQLVTVILSR